MNARLSKNGWWAVCSTPDCGTRLARRHWIPPEYQEEWAPWTHTLAIQPGFLLRSDGRWRMSERVWKRTAEGQSPAYRRDADARRVTPTLEGPGRDIVQEYPARVVCPDCQQEQLLDAAALGLGESSFTRFPGP